MTMNGLLAKRLKRKNPHPITSEKKDATKVSYDNRIKILISYGKPIPDDFLQEVCENMREWADKETSLRFKDYLVERRLHWKVFYQWCERYQPLQEEYDFTLAKIASRREIGAMTRKFDAASALRMMPRYDDEWITNELKLAEIKKVATGNQGNETKITVVMPEIASSPLVPERKRDDD